MRAALLMITAFLSPPLVAVPAAGPVRVEAPVIAEGKPRSHANPSTPKAGPAPGGCWARCVTSWPSLRTPRPGSPPGARCWGRCQISATGTRAVERPWGSSTTTPGGRSTRVTLPNSAAICCVCGGSAELLE